MVRQTRGEEMLGLLAAQKESGQTKQDFCKSQGIKLATFYYWQKKQREASEVGFSEVLISKQAELEICLPTGRWVGIRLADWSMLPQLLQALG